jgi:hypothetical protein
VTTWATFEGTFEEYVAAVERTYNSWKCMRERCALPRHPRWKYYGGRGITVCDRWLGSEGCANFFADMGLRPEDRTIDRIDVDGNYEPGNCRWATAKMQAANKRPRGSILETLAADEPKQTGGGPNTERDALQDISSHYGTA